MFLFSQLQPSLSPLRVYYSVFLVSSPVSPRETQWNIFCTTSCKLLVKVNIKTHVRTEDCLSHKLTSQEFVQKKRKENPAVNVQPEVNFATLFTSHFLVSNHKNNKGLPAVEPKVNTRNTTLTRKFIKAKHLISLNQSFLMALTNQIWMRGYVSSHINCLKQEWNDCVYASGPSGEILQHSITHSNSPVVIPCQD